MSDIDAKYLGLTANQLAKAASKLEDENEKLRKLFTDFWKWADPPFALKSGTYEQFMEICDRAHELGLLEIGA